MGLEADLKWIHKELDNVKDETLLQAIKNILEYRKKVASERISIEQYNKEMEASIAQIASGETIPHLEMGARIKQWAQQ